MAKFISAKTPRHYAQELVALETRRTELKSELKEIEEKEEFLKAYLRRKYPDGFNFASVDNYEMELEFLEFKKRYLNQAKVKALLGKKTPYSTTMVHRVRIGYVYE